ncbi:MAG: hypothetical protein JSS23_03135 [Proteobacteria bacterium]|nr:hypothetical protein [Pseudomonadota bacterium]
MSFYGDLAADADSLLKEFGAAGTITRKEQSGEYDPATGNYTEAIASQDVTALVIDYPQRLIDNTTVLQGDKQVYVSAVGLITPKPTDRLAWQGRDYTVVNVKDLAPAGLSVLVELQVRA